MLIKVYYLNISKRIVFTISNNSTSSEIEIVLVKLLTFIKV